MFQDFKIIDSIPCKVLNFVPKQYNAPTNKNSFKKLVDVPIHVKVNQKKKYMITGT